MPTREDMAALAQDIIRGHEERTDAGARLRRAEAQRRRDALLRTAQLKTGLAVMARELRAELSRVGSALSQAEAERQREAQQETSHRRQETAERRSDVTAQLEDYDKSHAAMSRELRADLLQAARALREAEADRQGEARQDAARRKTDVAAQASDVAAQLEGYDEARAAMSRELRADLLQATRALSQDVAARLAGHCDEQAGARAAWQEMAVISQTKRGVAVPVAEPPALPVGEAASAPSAGVEEAAATPPLKIEEVAEPPASLRDRVFSYLADRPDGARLVEIERAFGLGRFQAIRLVRDLIEEGNTEKRDLLYFAT